MDRSTFVFALFLLVGATKINGDSPSLKPESSEIPPNAFEPIFEERPIPPEQIKGHLLKVSEGCGYSPMGAPRVIGGGPARNGAYPWMVLLGYSPVELRSSQKDGPSDTMTGFRCGGTLITSRHVLTAAHCLGKDLWFARVGEHDFRTTSDGEHQDIPIVDAQHHPQYDNYSQLHDVAMLRLKQDVLFTSRIRPICLPIDEMRNFDFNSRNPIVAGWGQTSAAGRISPYLKHAQVPFVGLKECRQLHNMYISSAMENQFISKMVVCAGVSETQNSCQGDSGGPLMAPIYHGSGKFPFYQIGIASWGPCGKNNTPTVFTSVQYYDDWIQSMLQ